MLGERGLIFIAGHLHPLVPVVLLKVLLQGGVALAAEGNAGVCDNRPCGTTTMVVGQLEMPAGQRLVNGD